MRSIELIAKKYSCIDNLVEFIKQREFFTHIITIDNPHLSTLSSLETTRILLQNTNLKVISTINLTNKTPLKIYNIVENTLKYGTNKIALVGSDDATYTDIIRYLRIFGEMKIFGVVSDINNAKRRILCGFDGVFTQSFYNIATILRIFRDCRNMDCTMNAKSHSKINAKNRLLQDLEIIKLKSRRWYVEKHRQDSMDSYKLQDSIIHNLGDLRYKLIPSFFPFFTQKSLESWRNNSLGIIIPKNYTINQNKKIFGAFCTLPHFHISMLNSNFTKLHSLF